MLKCNCQNSLLIDTNERRERERETLKSSCTVPCTVLRKQFTLHQAISLMWELGGAKHLPEAKNKGCTNLATGLHTIALPQVGRFLLTSGRGMKTVSQSLFYLLSMAQNFWDVQQLLNTCNKLSIIVTVSRYWLGSVCCTACAFFASINGSWNYRGYQCWYCVGMRKTCRLSDWTASSVRCLICSDTSLLWYCLVVDETLRKALEIIFEPQISQESLLHVTDQQFWQLSRSDDS